MTLEARRRNEECYQWAMLGALMANKAMHNTIAASEFTCGRIAEMAAEVLSSSKTRPTLEAWILRSGVSGLSDLKAADALAQIVRTQAVADATRRLLTQLEFGVLSNPGQAVGALQTVVASAQSLLAALNTKKVNDAK
ncbi:MAG: hypothetical protein KGL39_47645 [Patescibacteria group bacterium]|nr:hypothetical protein [Patescibacteria group bacterium]